ncbi:alpha/beta fold hydrolase [Actinokineospora xionganensis]|uniref:Alpha/beta fold hydrolase n=1 Tax=Actinokineospora xionganensis TaxID=2684470 RepID=A0ABR7L5Q5_9PSEU|nr:alpha/beta fold hydrolase [Actinokineospora xionganensis]MBC6448016.1 alpha/beta fold hydrolase [Actinokineospora xionganensis]
MTIFRGDWVRCYRPRPYATRRLVCFPHAAGAAGFYRQWVDTLPADIELWAVQYPGREDRFTEPCVPDMETLADLVADALAPALDLPTALFGHSMGAAVGYEVTRRLLGGGAPVERLFVSARPSPSHQRATRTEVYLCDDDGIVAELATLRGSGLAVLDQPELRELVLPMVRNDFRLIETYRPAVAAPLPIPILALAGADDPRMTVAQAADWAEATDAGFGLEVFPGGHFYLEPLRGQVIKTVIDQLTDEEKAMTTPDELTVDGIRASVAELLAIDVDRVGPEDNLLMLGVDSIKLMGLASRWQRHGVEVPFVDLAENPTAAHWSKLLSGAA